jgi:hypothetical protein
MPSLDHLSIIQKDIKEPFRILKRLCKPKKGEEASLSYDGACLHIECAGVTVAPAAKGEWNGQARIPGITLMALVKAPPAGDPLEFTVEGSILRINCVSVPCIRQPAWSKVIDLPVNYTLEDVSALGDRYTEQEIIESGLGEIFKRAVLEFPRRSRNGQFKQQGKTTGKTVDPRQLKLWN